MSQVSVGKVGHGKEVHAIWSYKQTVKTRLGDKEVDMHRACCGTGDIGRGTRRSSTITKVNGATEITCLKCLKVLAENKVLAQQLEQVRKDAMVDNLFKMISIIGRKTQYGI